MVNTETVIPEELKGEYPFIPASLELANQYKLSYVDEGQGEPILLLHGNPTWSFYYRNVIKELSKNYRVIAPDHLGCGLSDKPQDYDYTLKNHIANIEQLIQFLDLKKIRLVVHDWGGAIGMGVATNNPENIAKIALLNTAAFKSERIPFSINLCRVPVLGEILVRRFNAFAAPATVMAVRKPLSKLIKKGFILPYNNYRNRIATAKFVQDIPMDAVHPSFSTLNSIEENLVNVTCPKKLFWGQHDFCFDMSFYKRWLKIYPEIERKVYSDAGHYVLEDAKEEIISDIREFFER